MPPLQSKLKSKHLCSKRVAIDVDAECEVFKWLRQLSKDFYGPTATRKTPDTEHDGGRYGNGILHYILGIKERPLFHLTQIEPAEVLFRFVLGSKTNSSPKEVRLVCQMLRLILYPFPSSLRLVYLR
ncbi:hypothetical protein AVEN_45928-1 [Araneus ventricosus]|uniref:Uncharacterized protein n=1 Tax=Araneus ventricosus TaxID=182803 RepID=A0A4Y2E8S6_ARAVE|nr:hypothetical protein AVEN_45928-1 [Araneus ventricosus]